MSLGTSFIKNQCTGLLGTSTTEEENELLAGPLMARILSERVNNLIIR
jgi:hypothetical protein